MVKLYVIVILLLLLLGCDNSGKEMKMPASGITREINKLRLTEINGKAVSLKQYEGKTVFINFWATWCKPCLEEMPSIEAAKKILQDENIIFLMASDESTEQINEFKNSHDYKFNYVRIENSEEINVQALPTTFIFNKKGEKVFSEAGVRDWDEKSNIDTILKIINK